MASDATGDLPFLQFVLRNYKNFNARATRDAIIAYWRHIERGGRMFWAVAGAMSSAQLGITLAPAIRAGLIHGLSVTGANLEESLFRLVAHQHYKDFPDYRYFTKQDDTRILEDRMRRVTDTSIPEDEAFRAVEKFIVPMWKRATDRGERRFWHEYFYELIQAIGPELQQGAPDECWLLAAAQAKLPVVVPGYEDSTFGNIFASHVKNGECGASIAKSGIEYMAAFYDQYRELSAGAGVGFFQIGGGIAGDFPICVVPSIKYDLEQPVKPWAYFCQISDSTTSYGSYSGATPNEKITWDKLTADTPMFVIESDATIVAPLLLRALLECRANPQAANAIIARG
jgi:deoxyhypusine synthase